MNDSMLQAINHIFIDVLDDSEIIITAETSASDVEAWDSLNHIQLVVAIEKHFKVRFTTGEIYAWKTVGDMCKSINEKVTA